MWHFVMGYKKVANNEKQLQTLYKWSMDDHLYKVSMKVYMLTIYIIHVEHDDIMLSHHLELDVVCDLLMQLMEFQLYMLIVT